MSEFERKYPQAQHLVPMVIERTSQGERAYDIFSRLLKDRIVFIGSLIDDTVANLVMAQLLFLDAEDSGSDIYLYINSPGGSVYSGMAIYDTMQYVKPDVATVCMGLAASMGSFLLGAGEKGKRFALPNSKLLIHQVMGGAQGQASDIDIQAREILRIRDQINKIMADYTGQPLVRIEKDTDRDLYMDPKEAKKYGLIDEIITSRP